MVFQWIFELHVINKLQKIRWTFERVGTVVVVVIIPSLPRVGDTARTAIQVHTLNLIAIRLGKDSSPFRTSYD